ncbi:hypothetical protein EVAR_11315_1 [Eumeta japonica]|uniref:Uncharacterized protein n=1 Tax=Eumeta variegata TaxID=151549 RepID=A0A4C1U0Q3_EUMVA|nr:hypothetical protein EVAR_11315_1 [Eumeta japonica]
MEVGTYHSVREVRTHFTSRDRLLLDKLTTQPGNDLVLTCETDDSAGNEEKSFISDLGKRLKAKGATPFLVLIYSKPYRSPSNAAMPLATFKPDHTRDGIFVI